MVVSDDDYPPYVLRSDGRLVGLLVDEWALWSRATGVPVDLRPMDWSRARQVMAEGGADVIDTIFDAPDRRATLDFTPPYADLPVPVYVHRDVGGITEPSDLRPFVVAAKAGDACVDRLRQAGVRSVDTYESYTRLVDAAVAGRVRIFCMDAPPANYLLLRARASGDFRPAFTLYAGQFHRAVHKGDAATLDYDNVKGIAVLTGNASVVQKGRGEAHGDKLTYDTKTSEMTGESGGSSQVHLIFQPKKKAAAPASGTKQH